MKRRTVNSITIILLAVLVTLSFFFPIPWWAYVPVAFFWFLITLCGSFFIGWNYHLSSLHSNKYTLKNQVALTFDDGPHPQFTPKVLDLLKQYNTKATFFCVGRRVEKHPEIFKRILDEGHCVGNHTYSHSKSFGFFNTEKVTSELKKTIAIVERLTSKEMKLYRPAFGVTNPMIEKTVQKLGVKSIGWNVRSLDTTSRSEKMVLGRITSRISKGDVVLLHDTSQKTVSVLEQLLLFLEQKKITSVTVDQLLGIKPYA